MLYKALPRGGGHSNPLIAHIKTKLAFTLAEILITLGIIGVVAAMTIPNLMTSIQEKQTVSKLRATQSILAQALKNAEEDVGTPADWGLEIANNTSDAKIIAEKLKPYLKIAIDCGVTDSKNFCVSPTYKFLSGGDSSYYKSSNYYKVKLLNGTSIWWRSGNPGTSDLIAFLVDINGVLPPNVWGKDLFGFNYKVNQGLVPGGGPNSTSCDINSTGVGCTYQVLQTGSMSYLHKK